LKKALTLIELIFTILIISLVFTVIPKIIYVSNKSLEFSKKEDAVFNMMSKIMDISLKEYDEKNTEYDDILLSGDDGVLECNSTTGYREGGFVGSRNCKNAVFESSIGPDASEPPYDDVDDYNGIEENTTKNGRTVYTLNISAGYTGQWDAGDYSSKSLSFIFDSVSDTTKTNIKRIYVSVSKDGQTIASIPYYSANIGHIKIQSVQW